MLLLKTNIDEKISSCLVGIMLISLGLSRLFNFHTQNKLKKNHIASELHTHDTKLAYGVGFVHGLAGSGALILLVVTQSQNSLLGMTYLLIFGVGSIIGMMIDSGIFSIPFIRKLNNYKFLRYFLTFASVVLYFYIGIYLAYSNFPQ